MKAFLRKHWILLFIPFGVAVDQITKSIAELQLSGMGDVWVIDNFFSFTLAYNTGAAWGMFAGQRWFLIGGPLLVLILCTIFYFQSKKIHLNIGLIVIMTGAIGNLIDRIATGAVVDFLRFLPFGYDFPVFNFADMCITLGCIYMMICLFFEKEDLKNA